MFMRTLTVGLAALLSAVPAAAQERGTMEFGAFGSAATFDNALSLKTGYGGGGRIAMFLDPHWSTEFEKGEMRANRPNGLKDVNVGILAGRLMLAPSAGPFSLLFGAGAGISTETNFLHTYGLDALVGARIKVGDNAALRVDGVMDWLANEKWKTYKTVRVGLSLYRHPDHLVRTSYITTPAPPPIVRDDSVSASETRRLREQDAALRALRDSLANAPKACVSATMAEGTVTFAADNATLPDDGKRMIDEKIGMFCNDPSLTTTIVLVGYRMAVRKEASNMDLGVRRAQATKEYLVSRGISDSRIVIDTAERPANSSDALRRPSFRLVIAPDAGK